MAPEERMPVPEGHYSRGFHCYNCVRDFAAKFKKGEVAQQPVCPYCGVSPAQIDKHVRWTEHGKYRGPWC